MLDPEKHCFIVPKKEISSPVHLDNKWINSMAYKDILGFILKINEKVKGIARNICEDCSNNVVKISELIKTLNQWLNEIPPTDQPQRFGNTSFRVWLEKLEKEKSTLLETALGEKYIRSIPEISVYLYESFGNKFRIDYGTGHELAFVTFLLCLCKIGFFQESDLVAISNVIFADYVEFVRTLQKTYRMEPAGSHGVYSLDDFQFVPFIWGSSQLIGNEKLLPSCIPDHDVASKNKEDNMFMACLNYINEVKTGPFAEHSNTLWGISSVHSWNKINSGLIKMYKVEVLGKFPVIQHFLFGSLLSIEPAS